MKRIALFFILITTLYSCSKDTWEAETAQCNFTDTINWSHQKSLQLQSIIDKYTKKGIPGITIAVYTTDGYWAGSSGYSKIETRTLMQPCHLQYSQSVSKTYMAVAILKLYEQGKIKLDEKITTYLPKNISSKVTDAEKITVRMLLNHTSGVPEYIDNPNYVSYLLQHPLHTFTTMDYLNYIDGRPLQFTPGSKTYTYTNTNYLLLALIGDYLTGDHAKFIRDELFKPLGLIHSFYHDDSNYLDKPELINTYWDRYSNYVLENCSDMHKTNVKSLIGDDGMIATPLDYVKFLRALFNHQLLADSTMQEMLTFIPNAKDENSSYGLGIYKELYKGKFNYGHTGGGIGSGCVLSYFPHNNAFVFVAINVGTSIYSPIFDETKTLVDDVYDALIQ